MGVNMRIFHCYGIVKEELDMIPPGKYNEYCDNFYDKKYSDIVIFGDCYSGEWEFIGQIIEETRDFIDDGLVDFVWEIDEENENRYVDEICMNYLQRSPRHYVLTYYS